MTIKESKKCVRHKRCGIDDHDSTNCTLLWQCLLKVGISSAGILASSSSFYLQFLIM